MSSGKRQRKINDVVSLLGILQEEPGVNPRDYAEICRLLSIYDQAENNITRQEQRVIAKHALYSKTCYLVFTDLCNVSLASSKLLSTLKRIDRVVETSKTIPSQLLLSEAICAVKQQSQTEWEAQQRKIAHDCSQLQISLRIKTMSRIVQIGFSCCASADSVPARSLLLEEVNPEEVIAEFTIPEHVLHNRLYSILKNYCLLGAVIAHTEVQKCQLRVSLSKLVFRMYPRAIANCGDLERAETAIYETIQKAKKAKSVRRQNNKVRKQAIEQLHSDFVVLNTELDSARAKLVETKLAIKAQQAKDELLAAGTGPMQSTAMEDH